LTSQLQSITVQIKYKNFDETFVGQPEQVWLALNKFFNEFVPSFEIANQLTLKVDMQSLAKDCEGIIAFSKEGANLMMPRSKLTDNETLILWLLANRLGKELNVLKSDAVPREELQTKLGKDAKITGTRLGELVKSEIAVKSEDDAYSITSFGIMQAEREILPRVKTKIL
jgi:hypothetical protein